MIVLYAQRVPAGGIERKELNGRMERSDSSAPAGVKKLNDPKNRVVFESASIALNSPRDEMTGTLAPARQHHTGSQRQSRFVCLDSRVFS